jgi:hypothetical protein
MKIFFLFLLSPLLFVGTFSQTFASFECGGKDDICLCEQAWSKAFDMTTTYMVNEELSVFLSQNTVSPADMWSGLRALSTKNRCLLGAVCQVVHVSQDESQMEGIFSPNNPLGGAIPGSFAACSPNISLQDIFRDIPESSEIITDLVEKCSFSEEEDGFSRPQDKTKSEIMYSFCTKHLEVSSLIFDRATTNLIWKDVNRKIEGFFSKKISSLTFRIRELENNARQFIDSFNSIMGMLCTLSHPD